MNKAQIKKRLKELVKIGNNRGPAPKLLTDKEFQGLFIEALVATDGNGKQTHEYLNRKGQKISYKQCQEYVRRILGSYPVTGRPPKYMNEERERILEKT